MLSSAPNRAPAAGLDAAGLSQDRPLKADERRGAKRPSMDSQSGRGRVDRHRGLGPSQKRSYLRHR